MAELYESRNVSVIGLGNMGSALAEALLNSGHRVTVWNRTVSKSDPLSASGTSVAPSVVEATRSAEVIVVCVTDHDAAMSLLRRDDVAGALRDKVLVQLSTVTAEESRQLAGWMKESGADYLDGSILA